MQLNSRAQLSIVLGGIIAAAVILYAGLWRPVSEHLEESRLENRQVLQSLAGIRDYAERYTALQNSRSSESASGQSLTSRVNDSLRSRRLQLSRIQQSGESGTETVQIRFDNANFSEVLGWLYDMEGTPGLVLQEVTANPTGTGLANISISLSRIR